MRGWDLPHAQIKLDLSEEFLARIAKIEERLAKLEEAKSAEEIQNARGSVLKTAGGPVSPEYAENAISHILTRLTDIEVENRGLKHMLSALQSFHDPSCERWVTENGSPRTRYCKVCVE